MEAEYRMPLAGMRRRAATITVEAAAFSTAADKPSERATRVFSAALTLARPGLLVVIDILLSIRLLKTAKAGAPGMVIARTTIYG
jgi:hypothetical protein